MSFTPSAAANFFSKIMFKKKLEFFPLKWAMLESGATEIGGDIYISNKNSSVIHIKCVWKNNDAFGPSHFILKNSSIVSKTQCISSSGNKSSYYITNISNKFLNL